MLGSVKASRRRSEQWRDSEQLVVAAGLRMFRSSSKRLDRRCSNTNSEMSGSGWTEGWR